MPQVAARIRRARLTIAARIERPVVRAVRRVPNVERAVRRERRAVAPATRRGDAVEQIDAALDRRHEIFWKPDAHKITGKRVGEPRLQDVERGVHLRFRLADRQSAYRYARPRA